MGCAQDPWRIADAGIRGRPVDGLQIYGAGSKAAVAATDTGGPICPIALDKIRIDERVQARAQIAPEVVDVHRVIHVETSMRTRNAQRYTAVHEAGHAVASWHVQQLLRRDWCQFDRVFIRTSDEIAASPYVDPRGRAVQCDGMLEGPSYYNPGVFNPFSGPPDLLSLHRQNMEAEVMTSLAGPIAEARFLKCSLAAVYLVGGGGDYDMVKRCLADFEREVNVSEAFGKLEQRSRTIVRHRWSAVLALADELLVRRSLTGPDAVAVIEAAVGK